MQVASQPGPLGFGWASIAPTATMSRGATAALNRAVETAAVDETRNDAVHLVANGNRRPGRDRRAAVQREDELVSQPDRGFDELAKTITPGRRGLLGRFRIRQHHLERSVGEVVQQVLTGGEVTVERRDSDAGIGSDRRHPHAQALAMDGGRRRPHERLAIDGSIATPLRRALPHRTTHESI